MIKDRIEKHYNRYDEENRLARGSGIVEFEKTKEILSRYLECKKYRILDLGGATGRYSFWLQSLGHNVVMIEPVKKHIDIASAINHNLENKIEIIHGNAQEIKFDKNKFDIILNFGPMYHITKKSERIDLISKIKNILVPGGLLFISFISRFASLLDGYRRMYIKDNEFQEIVKMDLDTGRHYPSKDGQRYFTDSYLKHPGS